jgi:hypothetical protein
MRFESSVVVVCRQTTVLELENSLGASATDHWIKGAFIHPPSFGKMLT